MARELARNGIMVLRFDFRYSGESEGDFENMTLSDEISDGLKSIDYIISECNADPKRIGILGLSMGGAVGGVVAGSLGSKIKSCLLMNPVGRPFEDICAIALSKNIHAAIFPVDYNAFLFGKRFFDDLKNVNPLEEIKTAQCPVLIINGSEDKSVSPTRSKEYFDTITNNGGSAELFVVEGADHVFTSNIWEREVITKVRDWFSATL